LKLQLIGSNFFPLSPPTRSERLSEQRRGKTRKPRLSRKQRALQKDESLNEVVAAVTAATQAQGMEASHYAATENIDPSSSHHQQHHHHPKEEEEYEEDQLR